MQDTMERSDEQRDDSRALARNDRQGGIVQVSTRIDLDDQPIYASTGVHKIPLGRSGVHWIEIQEALDFGQQTVLDNASVVGVMREQANEGSEAGQTVRLDLTRQRFLLCAMWLTRWNVPNDKNGKPVRLPRNVNDRIDVLKRLNPIWGDAIVQSITEYVASQQAEEEEAQRQADEEAGIEPANEREQNYEGSEDSPKPSLNGGFRGDDS